MERFYVKFCTKTKSHEAILILCVFFSQAAYYTNVVYLQTFVKNFAIGTNILSHWIRFALENLIVANGLNIFSAFSGGNNSLLCSKLLIIGLRPEQE
jgi:hypothetical protein